MDSCSTASHSTPVDTSEVNSLLYHGSILARFHAAFVYLTRPLDRADGARIWHSSLSSVDHEWCFCR